MRIIINTADPQWLIISLYSGKNTLATQKIESRHAQAEKLLPLVEVILKEMGGRLSDIKKVVVASAGSGFTSLRIGVATANALAYALNIPIEPLCGRALLKKGIRVVAPEYAAAPSITIKNS